MGHFDAHPYIFYSVLFMIMTFVKVLSLIVNHRCEGSTVLPHSIQLPTVHLYIIQGMFGK